MAESNSDNPYESPRAKTASPAPDPSRHDPYAILKIPTYRKFLCGNVLAAAGMQMQSAAVLWEVHARTKSPSDPTFAYDALSYVGLSLFLPVVLWLPIAGHLADRWSRRGIAALAMLATCVSSIALAAISFWQLDYRLIYIVLVVVGSARAFSQPAKASLLPLLVPFQHFPAAVTWNSGGFQLATVFGPTIAGVLIAHYNGPRIVYLADAAITFGFAVILMRLRLSAPETRAPRSDSIVHELLGGWRYVWSNQVVLGAITLDMFAVLLGGAVALLPVYADEILKVSPIEFGWLQAAPGAGALVMAILLAHRRALHRMGWTLLTTVTGFGVATIIFGLSENLYLSLAMLFLMGMFDSISVVIRHTLVQTQTPDVLRGRVSAINSLFIGASNELGGFESGKMAYWFGPAFSVVSGGIGTLLVVTITALRAPRLRDFKHVTVAEPVESEAELARRADP